jgi:hypothetical protein
MDYKTNHIIGATAVMPSARLYIGSYRDGKFALIIGDREGEDFLVATVALEDAPDISPNVWLKGWSENKDVPEALEAAGLVRRTGRKRATGFVYAEEAEVLPSLAADIQTYRRQK